MRSSKRWIRAVFVFGLLVAAFSRGLSGEIDFNRDVQPILSENCYFCHGPDADHREGGLRLDIEAEAKRKAIVAGDAEMSPLIIRLRSSDPDEKMPPEDSGRNLTKQQVAVLKQWIAEGGNYREHWAFDRLARPTPPTTGDAWVRNPIDEFVLKRLRAEGLEPNAEASRSSLIRRASLTVTGLPPTSAEIDAFLSDPSPDAYERVVDRLLKSERYGERMAMWWLDGARYADSHGFQADWERYQWPWRDWVIRAFNRNQPFDQFTVEQLAGDLLPGATREQILATGFNRNHRVNTEGGSLDAEWLVENVIDRVETMGSVWLGLTLNCARCHDHKYDPVTQKEFYQLFAFFHNVPEAGKGPGKQGNFDPVLKLPSESDQMEIARLDAAIRDAESAVKGAEQATPEAVAAWEKQLREKRESANRWRLIERADVVSQGGAEIVPLGDASFLPTGKQETHEVYTLEAKIGAGRLAALMLEAIPDKSMVEGRLGRAQNGNFVLSGVEVELARPEFEKRESIPIVKAEASYEQKDWPVASLVTGAKRKGWAVDGNRFAERRRAVFRFGEALEITAEHRLIVRLRCEALSKHALGRFRLFTTDDAAAGLAAEESIPKDVKAVLDVAVDDRDAKQRAVLSKFVAGGNASKGGAARARLDKLKKEKEAFEKRVPSAMVMSEMKQPRVSRLLIRGQYDQPGEVVQPGLPAAFPGLPGGNPTNRLGLAKWIISTDNPLTARVQVNRLWEILFGNGLVKSSENVGMQAEFPSHPELLDWLASEFVRLDWDIKDFLKTLLTSATFRQSSVVTEQKLNVDPMNRLLSRGPRFRVQAEIVRDQALFLAGLLVERQGGPSVYPYQPAGLWSEFNFYGNLRNYQQASDSGLYRRSLYTIWKRTAAPPGMTLFDMPSREICTVKRPRTNTPLQALALMNDVTYVEASRRLAERMMGAETGVDAQIRTGFRWVASRWPTDHELSRLRAGFDRRLARFESEAGAAKALVEQGESDASEKLDPARLAAMTTVASILLNLDEAITN